MGEGREVQVYTWALLVPGVGSAVVSWLTIPCDMTSIGYLDGHGPSRGRGSPSRRRKQRYRVVSHAQLEVPLRRVCHT